MKAIKNITILITIGLLFACEVPLRDGAAIVFNGLDSGILEIYRGCDVSTRDDLSPGEERKYTIENGDYIQFDAFLSGDYSRHWVWLVSPNENTFRWVIKLEGTYTERVD